MYWNRICFAFLAAILITGEAYGESQMSVSRLYLIDPDPNDINNSIDALEAAVKVMDIKPSKQIGLMPENLSDKPGEIEVKQVSMGPMTFNIRGCGNSYAQLGTQSGYGNSLGINSNSTFGCLYLSKSAIRMAVVFEQKQSSGDSISGWIAGGIKSAVLGSDKDYAKKIFEKMITAAKEKVPNLLIELEEVPGEVARPDQDKVALLFQKLSTPSAGSSVNSNVPSAPNVATSANTPTAPDASSSPSNTPAQAVQVSSMQSIGKSGGAILSDSERKIELLGKLADLKKAGVLTDEEFEAQKKKILGN